MLVFLKINHVELQCQDEDIINLGLDIASGKPNVRCIGGQESHKEAHICKAIISVKLGKIFIA